MQAAHKCMVLYRKSLLAQGIAHLVRAERDMEVTLANMEQVDPMEAVCAMNPDVLILDMNNLKEMDSFLADLLINHPSMKIVGLDPLKSAIYIFRPRLKAVKNAQEFLDILREDI